MSNYHWLIVWLTPIPTSSKKFNRSYIKARRAVKKRIKLNSISTAVHDGEQGANETEQYHDDSIDNIFEKLFKWQFVSR